MKIKTFPAGALTLAPLLALSPVIPTAAEKADGGAVDAYDIEEIVVTASRREQSAFAEPFMINARGMEELQAVRQVRTIPDALRDSLRASSLFAIPTA